ncbi:MAG: 3-deoxy-manno-octulosonate cytidylyltransferase, partial [Dehalococcoidales bacterium]
MNVIGIIPARMGSSRFPGKPLAKILGIPMIGHIYHRCKMAATLNDVYLATCDEEIMQYAASINAKAMMTSDKHERASDRVAEATGKIEKMTGKKVDIVVMIQGDEPMVMPEMINQAVQPMLQDKKILVANLLAPIKTQEEFEDPNSIKVVVDNNGDALYFSREPIPSQKKWKGEIPMFKQVCIIPFRRNFLSEFNRLTPTPLEKVESIDMLRVLEHGHKVKMVLTDFETYSVDTPEDLLSVAERMKNDT